MQALITSRSKWQMVLSLGTLVIAIFIPFIFPKGFVLTFLTQVTIVSVFALSYNMLLGQTGLLSFGHAVYSGIGGYFAIHMINKLGADFFGLGMAGIPLIGAVGGAVAGFVFGYISTQRAGTVFAMITLGVAEMIVALAAMLPTLSGGEAGITTNRMLSSPVIGVDFGSPQQVYYVAMTWFVVSVLAMYAVTLTPLGRLANAVRDNAERAAFVGFNPRRVRHTMMILAGGFAGVAGGMSILNYELVTSENLGIGQSGMVLIATYLGGIGNFLGPIVGAFIYVLFLSLVSTLTKAWLLYFGILFITIVLFAPDGLVSILRNETFKRLPAYKICLAVTLTIVAVVVIEAVYALHENGVGDVQSSLTSVTDIRHYVVATLVIVVVGVVATIYRISKAGPVALKVAADLSSKGQSR